MLREGQTAKWCVYGALKAHERQGQRDQWFEEYLEQNGDWQG